MVKHEDRTDQNHHGMTSMARIDPLPEAETDEPRREALEHVRAAHGRLTNMKRTLARSPVALRSLMTWYELRDAIVEFLGERPALLFAHAISTATNCLVCSTFFRRILTDAGDNPDHPTLDERERLLIDYGRQLAHNPHEVSDDLFSRLKTTFDAEQVILLTAFGGLMVATNLFNNALRVDLDEYLWPYRKASEVRASE